MSEGGNIIVHRTEKVFKNIFLFWVLCALEKKCAEPTRLLGCNNTKLSRNMYAGEFCELTESQELEPHLSYLSDGWGNQSQR